MAESCFDTNVLVQLLTGDYNEFLNYAGNSNTTEKELLQLLVVLQVRQLTASAQSDT